MTPPLVQVQEAAAAVQDAQTALRITVSRAVAAGIPATKVAAAAGVDRNTIARWVKEDQQP